MKLYHVRLLLRRPDDGAGSGAAPAPAAAPSAPVADASQTAPAPAPASEPAPSSSSPMVSTNIGDVPADIMALFNGDPSPTSTPEPVQAQPGQTPPAATPQGTQPGASQPQVPAAPTPAAPAPNAGEQAALAAAIQSLSETVSRQAAGQPQQPQGQPQADQVELPSHGYQFAIPEGLSTALMSDDLPTRNTALQALIQGTSRTIHTEVVKAMRQEFSKAVPGLVQTMLRSHQNQQSVFQDFYGKHQHLANPIFRPIVQQVAVMVARERGAAGWSPELRDAIAERVNQQLQGAGFQFTAAPQVQVQPAAPVTPAGPAAIVPGGARPAQVVDPTAQFRELL